MTMISGMRSFLGFVQKGVHPREVGLAVLLGALAGFVSGWNLTLGCVLVLALALRAPVKVFLQAWGVFAAAAWVLVPQVHHTGKFLLEESMMGRWLAPHADSIWMVLFDADRYTLVGGAVWGLGIGLAAALLACLTTRILQTRIAALSEQVHAQQSGLARAGMKMLCWLLLGGLRRDLQVPENARWVRPAGVVLCLLIIAPAALVSYYCLPAMLTRSLLHSLSLANGADVEADAFELSLSDGLLTVRNLQVADPEHLDHDRVRIARLAASVQPARLLRGYVHIDKVLLEGISENVLRQAPARPCMMSLPDFDFGGESAEELSTAENTPRDDSWNLSQYVRDWDKYQQRLTQARQMLKKAHQLSQLFQEEETPGKDVPATYLALRSQRCAFGRPRMARVQVNVIRARSFADSMLGHDALAELTNLTSSPTLTGKPTCVQLVAPSRGVRVAASLNLHKPGAKHDVQMESRSLRMDQLLDMEKLSQHVALSGGKLLVRGKGSMNLDEVQLALTANLAELRLQVDSPQSLLGISPQSWNEGLAQVSEFRVQGRLKGPWTRPALTLNRDELLAQLQQQLQAAGCAMLAKALHEQLTKGEALVQAQVQKGAALAEQAIDKAQAQATAVADRASQELAKADAAARVQIKQHEEQIRQAESAGHEAIAQQSAAVQAQIDKGHEAADKLLDKYASTGGQNALDQILGQDFSRNLLGQGVQSAKGAVAAGEQKAQTGVAAAGSASRSSVQRGSAWYDQRSDEAHQLLDQGVAQTRAVGEGAKASVEAGSARGHNEPALAAAAVHAALLRHMASRAASSKDEPPRDEGAWAGGEVQLSDRSDETPAPSRGKAGMDPAVRRTAAAGDSEYVVGGGYQQALAPKAGEAAAPRSPRRTMASQELYAEESIFPPPTPQRAPANAAPASAQYPNTQTDQSQDSVGDPMQSPAREAVPINKPPVPDNQEYVFAREQSGEETPQPGIFRRVTQTVGQKVSGLWPFGKSSGGGTVEEEAAAAARRERTAAAPPASRGSEPRSDEPPAGNKAWYQKLQFWK